MLGGFILFTRNEIVDFSVRMWCKRDLTQKGMVLSPSGNVFCIATLSGPYRDEEYYSKGIKSPQKALYYGVNSVRATDPFDVTNSETKKNIAVKKTDGIVRFVYLFEKIDRSSDKYFFHGRYKYITYDIVKNIDPDRHDDVLFHLAYIDRPNIE